MSDLSFIKGISELCGNILWSATPSYSSD